MVSNLDIDFIRSLILVNNKIKEKELLSDTEQKEINTLKTILSDDYLPGMEDLGREVDMIMGCDSILKNCQGFFNYIKLKSIDISYNEYIKHQTKLAESIKAKPGFGDISVRMFLLSIVLIIERYFHLDQAELNVLETNIKLIKTPIVSFTKDRLEADILIKFTEINGNFELILPYFISKSLLEIAKYEALLGLGVAYSGAGELVNMMDKELLNTSDK